MELHPLCLALLGSLTLTAPAWAEQPSNPPSTPTTSALDVVLLKDGSMLRGTIAEKTSASVIIVTITGEKRTISMDQVKYAGPESERPGTQPPAPPPAQSDSLRPFATVHSGSSRLQFTSKPAAVTLHVHSSSGHGTGVGFSSSGRTTTVVTQVDNYSNLCTAPCEVTLPTGTHRLALSHDKGQPVEPDEPVRVEGDGKIEGKYISNSVTRIAGLGVLAGSLGVSLYLTLTASEDKEDCTGGYCSTTKELNMGKLYAGLGVMVGGGLIGWLLMSTSDEAEISVTPASSAALRGARVADRSDSVDTLVPRGATFYGRF